MSVTSTHPAAFPSRFPANNHFSTNIKPAVVAPALPRSRHASESDSLDLSAWAQLLLGRSDNLLPPDSGFLLNPSQQQQFDAIIARHQDASFTLDNFGRLMADLRVAGLAPEQLAVQDQVRFLDLSVILLDAAEGDNPGIDFNVALNNFSHPPLPDEEVNINSYILYVIRRWRRL